MTWVKQNNYWYADTIRRKLEWREAITCWLFKNKLLWRHELIGIFQVVAMQTLFQDDLSSNLSLSKRSASARFKMERASWRLSESIWISTHPFSWCSVTTCANDVSNWATQCKESVSSKWLDWKFKFDDVELSQFAKVWSHRKIRLRDCESSHLLCNLVGFFLR